MTQSKLSLLYEDIKAFRGLEIPLKEFEEKFSRVNPKVLKGNPAHLTLSFSLWGLQFKFPEDDLSKNLVTSLQLIVQAQENLKKYRKAKHVDVEKNREKIAHLIRQNIFASHSTILFSFSLIEAYLNGIAWEYINSHDISHLSNNKKKLLEDPDARVSTAKKLEKYPHIITGNELWGVSENKTLLDSFLEIAKTFRDSLVHPSPFSAPERFGGYDKLRLIRELHYGTAIGTANMLIDLVELIHIHVKGISEKLPDWFAYLKKEVKEVSEAVKKIEKSSPRGSRF